MNEWRNAGGWTGIVVLDGVDVTGRCLGVLYQDGEPIACKLVELNDAGRPFVRAGELAVVIVASEISADLRRLDQWISRVPQSVDYGADEADGAACRAMANALAATRAKRPA